MVDKYGKIQYLREIGGTPKGIQKFEGLPYRRFMNKAKFYGQYIRGVGRVKIQFSLN